MPPLPLAWYPKEYEDEDEAPHETRLLNLRTQGQLRVSHPLIRGVNNQSRAVES